MRRGSLWGPGITGASQGIVEGLDVGTRIRQQRADEGFYKDDMEQKRLMQALNMIKMAAGSDDPAVTAAIQRLVPGMQLPVPDVIGKATRGAEAEGAGIQAKIAQAKKMGLQEGTQPWFHMVFGSFSPKEGREFREINVPGIGMVPIDKAYHYMPKPGKEGGGSGGGGGKVSNIVNWKMANGSIVQAPFNQKPPGAVAMYKISTKDPNEEDAPQQRPTKDAVAIEMATERAKAGKATEEDIALLKVSGVTGGVLPTGLPSGPPPQASRFKGPKKQQRKQAGPPVAAPEDDEDEWGPSIER